MSDKFVPEGIEGMVPYKGTVRCHHLSDVRRPSFFYGLLRLPVRSMRCAAKPAFVEITSAGWRESHVHDVKITKEAPNYRLEH